MQEHFDIRKGEIIKACESLYDKYNFKDITIKLISEQTSFSRPSIYNYFETKEEIFLALFRQEYEKWTDELNKIREDYDQVTKDQFASLLAHTLENKKRLLKLLSMNIYDLEEHSRLTCLTEFKETYSQTIEALRKVLNKFFPKMSKQEVTEFIYTFFPFVFGIYPYTTLTEKQKQAMQNVGMIYPQYSVYELAYIGIKKLL